jgi:arylsulfatase A-like enzyme
MLGMHSRESRIALACAGALLVGACGSRTEDAAAGPRVSGPPPDIILVSIDSLRFDHLGCYGYEKPTSPNIDRIAKEGVRCASAVSTTSWTLPAHAALLTGLFDSTHGLVDNGLRLTEERPTLAAVLRGNGYQTGGFFGGPYLDPGFGFGHGFMHYESCMSPLPNDSTGRESTAAPDSSSHPSSTTSSGSAASSDALPTRADLERSHSDITGSRTLEAVTRWLGREVDQRPLFLFVHLWDVHYDYNPPREYVETFDPGYAGALDASNLMKNPAVNAHMAPRDFDHLVALYDGEIRFTDDILGRILSVVEKRGRMSNTLLVITADHGEEFFEHGGKGHQRTLFDEVVRVPLIVRWPGHLEAGRVVGEEVRLVDLMPTILASAGITKQPIMQGRDILALLRGEKLPAAPALCELMVDDNDVHALRTNAFKVIDYLPVNTTQGYDLVMDPRELRPIPDTVARVQAAKGDLERALEGCAALRKKIGESVQPAAAGEDVRRRIRGLGYGGDERARPK